MKSIILHALVLLTVVSPCFGGPKIKATNPVSIWNSDFVVVSILKEMSEIDRLLACFQRADEIGESSARGTFSHKIDLADRWLYDVERGEFMLLSKTKQSVYRLSEPDRKIIEALIQKNRAEPVATDNGSGCHGMCSEPHIPRQPLPRLI